MPEKNKHLTCQKQKTNILFSMSELLRYFSFTADFLSFFVTFLLLKAQQQK